MILWASSLVGFDPGALKEIALQQHLIKADVEKHIPDSCFQTPSQILMCSGNL